MNNPRESSIPWSIRSNDYFEYHIPSISRIYFNQLQLTYSTSLSSVFSPSPSMDINIFGIIPGIRKHRIEKEILSHPLPFTVSANNKNNDNQLHSVPLSLHSGYCGYESIKFQTLPSSSSSTTTSTTTTHLYQIQFVTLRQPTCISPNGEIITLHSTWKWSCNDDDFDMNSSNLFYLNQSNQSGKQSIAIPGIIEKTCELDETTGFATWKNPTYYCRM